MMSNSKNEAPHGSHSESQRDTVLDGAIDHALDCQPRTAIPAAFAARVRAALPAAVPAKPRISAGRRTAYAAAAVLLVAVFCIAPHTVASFSSLAFDVELSLLAELACIAAWLGMPLRES